MNARLTLAQTTLSKKLGISGQWMGELVSRLERAGWVQHSSQKLPDGTNSSTIFRAGRLLKRLLVILSKSHRGEKPAKQAAMCRWHFSPTEVEKKLLFILEKEKTPPTAETLGKIPLLKHWLDRGKE